MRKLSTSICITFILFCALSASSQAVITHASHAPFIGYGSTHMYIEDMWDPIDIDPGPAGANQSWDFSDYIGTDEEQLNFIDPEDTPFADSIAGSDINIAISNEFEDEAGYAFMQINSSAFTLKAFGILDEGEPMAYAMFNPSPMIMVFPFAYGGSFDTQGEMEINMEEMTMVQKMWSSSEADAWGNITTPHGSYSDVLRVKTTTTDSTFIYIEGNLLFEDGYISIDYAWYSSNHRTPVFEINGDYDDEFIPWHVGYLTGETVGIEEKLQLSLNVYPNPASGHVSIDIPNIKSGISVRMSDLTGRIVYEAPVLTNVGKFTFDVSGLAEGMYFIQLFGSDKIIGSQKIIIRK
jgi:hypothetical protein